MDKAERVVPVFTLIVVRVLTEKPGRFVKRVSPMVGEGDAPVVYDLIAQSLGELSDAPVGKRKIEGVRNGLNDVMFGKLRKFSSATGTAQACFLEQL